MRRPVRWVARWVVSRRWWPTTVRARATVAASLVVAAALTAASFALIGLLENNLLRNAENDARQQAESVAALAATGNLGRVRPLAPGVEFLQVVAADGTVLFSSPRPLAAPGPFRAGPVPVAPGPDPVTPSPQRPGLRLHTWKDRPFGGEQRVRVAQVVVDTPDGIVTVYAGASLRAADAADDTTTAALAIGMPLLLATVALVTWRVTGRALRPVEEIRAEVAEISDRDLHRRVPVPPTRDEVARLAQTMNTTLDRLEASGIRQRRFIADASHELRSPITVLRTQLEVAMAIRDPDLWPELIGGALEDVERLQQLAADLLLLARIDAAQPVPTVPLDLTELVRDVVEARAGDRVPVGTALTAGIRVTGNELWLIRIVTNLLDNAQRFAEERVDVVLRTAPGVDGAPVAVLEIVDDGPGIPPAERERVFERFTRLDDARSRDQGGAGLGLAIARDLAAHHGGSVDAEPSPGGARLVVRLPSPPSVAPAPATGRRGGLAGGSGTDTPPR
ncbi:sensor histidine kinase [Streptomyces sp. NPDC054949]|uniref:sensor histidine kinase n=1 Tax=Streptomyces sp. NBC_00424 TaxID=2903648 RepID=UPI00225AABEC|nr:ATP-binding protein [Streptomyces sp. NBC_00424]MCX5077352.1 ATP-binding protein [Streptomyces sp. NBC_00424]WUD39662.1 ATP-binding protein [Streptomyces sp. NBC_00513]